MNDTQIHDAIEQLVAEEHELWNREGDGEVSEAIDFAEYYLREFGADPDVADVRPEETVERYEQ